MPIFLDDEPVDLPGEDLGTVLTAARRQLEAAGRLVVEVQVDGQSLSGQELEHSQTTALGDRELRLYSAEPRALATQTLEQVRQRLMDAQALQEQAANLLQQDDAGEAMQKVAELVEIWLQTQQAVLHSATLMGVDLDELTVDGQPMRSFTNELIDRLKDLKQLITAQDVVGLADTLSYEWPELIERWDALIGRLVEQIESSPR